MKKQEAYNIILPSQGQPPLEKDFHADNSLFLDESGVNNSDILGADVLVHASISPRHDSFDLSLSFSGSIDVACHRCLDAVNIPVDTEYDIRVKFGDDFDDSDDEVLQIPWSATSLDLAPIIRDTLLLEVPLRCVHPDGLCNEQMRQVLKQHGSDPDSDSDNDEDDEQEEAED